MATIINISETNLLFAFNNNIVQLQTAINSIKCDITIDGTLFSIYPLSNKYFFNFKDIITAKINRNNYKDDANLLGSTIINATDKSYLETAVTFKIFFANGTNETVTKSLKWLSAFIQLKDWKQQYLISTLINKPFILMPFKKASKYGVLAAPSGSETCFKFRFINTVTMLRRCCRGSINERSTSPARRAE